MRLQAMFPKKPLNIIFFVSNAHMLIFSESIEQRSVFLRPAAFMGAWLAKRAA